MYLLGEARAIQLMAEAKAKAVTQVAEAIGQQVRTSTSPIFTVLWFH